MGMVKVKSSGNILNTSRQNYERITEKIDRNNKMIEELKKTTKKDQNYLKNINHKQAPTYIDLDKQKQTRPLDFKRQKK